MDSQLQQYFGDYKYTLLDITNELDAKNVKDILKHHKTTSIYELLKKDPTTILYLKHNTITYKLFEMVVSRQLISNKIFYNYMFIYNNQYEVVKLNAEVNIKEFCGYYVNTTVLSKNKNCDYCNKPSDIYTTYSNYYNKVCNNCLAEHLKIINSSIVTKS